MIEYYDLTGCLKIEITICIFNDFEFPTILHFVVSIFSKTVYKFQDQTIILNVLDTRLKLIGKAFKAKIT